MDGRFWLDAVFNIIVAAVSTVCVGGVIALLARILFTASARAEKAAKIRDSLEEDAFKAGERAANERANATAAALEATAKDWREAFAKMKASEGAKTEELEMTRAALAVARMPNEVRERELRVAEIELKSEREAAATARGEMATALRQRDESIAEAARRRQASWEERRLVQVQARAEGRESAAVEVREANERARRAEETLANERAKRTHDYVCRVCGRRVQMAPAESQPGPEPK